MLSVFWKELPGAANEMSFFLILFSSVLSSGVVAALISSELAHSKERWSLRRAKIEEIYLSGSSWLNYAHSDLLLYLRVCKGQLTYDQLLDLVLKKQDKLEFKGIGDLKLKMEMNIRMYEPSLVSYLENLETEMRKANKLRFAIESRYKKTGQASELFDPFNQQLERLGTVSDALISAIVQRGVSIGGERTILAELRDKLKDACRRFAHRLGLIGNAG